MDQKIVDIKNVSFSYNAEAVLEDVSLDIGKGDFIAVTGPNGGGKTTLLKLILGLLKPDRGSIEVLGQSALRAAPNIGYVPQSMNASASFPVTAIDVVLMGMLAPRKNWFKRPVPDRKKALSALEHMGVKGLGDRNIKELSEGQRQRVFIARALVTKPSLMLLDEPTASIDPRGQVDLYKMLEEINREIAIVVVSHDLLAVSRYAKSVVCVNRGLHHHSNTEVPGNMLTAMYPHAEDGMCLVELLTHDQPHQKKKDSGK